jgi:RHS repeat-associated protein
VTNEAGALVEEHDYDVFGQEVNAQPGTQPVRFSGKERDAETGWDYFGARYYGSKIGRFTTVDPHQNIEANLVNPQAWNRYSYVLNNPLRYTDPDGRCAEPVTCSLVVGLALTWGDVAFFGSAAAAATILANPQAVNEFVTSGPMETPMHPISMALDTSMKGLMQKGQKGQEQQATNGQSTSSGGNDPQGDRSGGGKTGRKLSKDRLANQGSTVDRLRAERDRLRSTANKTPEDKTALEAKERELNRATDRLRASEEHARQAQGGK